MVMMVSGGPGLAPEVASTQGGFGSGLRSGGQGAPGGKANDEEWIPLTKLDSPVKTWRWSHWRGFTSSPGLWLGWRSLPFPLGLCQGQGLEDRACAEEGQVEDLHPFLGPQWPCQPGG